MDSVRWGVLSVSGHYKLRVHGPLSRLPEARITAIASRDQSKASRTAAALGIPKAYGSYAELIADPEIDAVYIPLPNDLHAEWTIAALEAGKHVLCEKPMAMNADQARAMTAKSREKGLLLMEAFMYKFHPQWIHTAGILACGEIGPLRAIHIWFSYSNPDPANIRNKAENGGGALYDIGCYAVSVSRFLAAAAGYGEIQRVLALVERDTKTGTDTLSSGILDFGPGALRASFHVSTRAFPSQRVEVLGERGRIVIPLPFNMYADTPATLEVTTGVGTRRIKTGPADQYGLLFASFSRAILEGKSSPVPPEDGIRGMAVIDALFRSAHRGSWEDVESLLNPT
jgi:predicted dehydrogenase